MISLGLPVGGTSSLSVAAHDGAHHLQQQTQPSSFATAAATSNPSSLMAAASLSHHNNNNPLPTVAASSTTNTTITTPITMVGANRKSAYPATPASSNINHSMRRTPGPPGITGNGVGRRTPGAGSSSNMGKQNRSLGDVSWYYCCCCCILIGLDCHLQ